MKRNNPLSGCAVSLFSRAASGKAEHLLGAATVGVGRANCKRRTHLGAAWINNMCKKILAAGKAKQIALARASVRAMSRENAHV